MSEEEWPIGTPRDEVLARVVSRGNRIVAVRRAFSVAMLASVVGVSALGAGTVISNMGSKGTETEQIAALLPEQPEPLSGSTPGSSVTTSATDGSTSVATTVTGTGSTTVSAPGSTGTSVTAGGTAPTRRPRSTTTRPATVPTAPRPTSPATTAKPPVVTTTIAPSVATAKPSVGVLRMKADGVPMGDNVCENEPESRVLVAVDEATNVRLSLNHGKETRTVTMTLTKGEWSADIGPIVADPASPSLPVLVTVVATGPGGVTTSSAAITVVDCTP